MEQVQTQSEFITQYYETAKNLADITIANYIKKHGLLDIRIDVDGVKDIGVWNALEKAYFNFDSEHINKKTLRPTTIKAFLNTLVHNCVLTELNKEISAIGKNCVPLGEWIPDPNITVVSQEATLTKIEDCIKRLGPEDQAILNFWREDPKTYVERVLEELGLEDIKRNRSFIYSRLHRIIDAIRKMLENQQPDYTVHTFNAASLASRISALDYHSMAVAVLEYFRNDTYL